MAGPAIAEEGLSARLASAASPARGWANSTLAAFSFPIYRILWLGSFLGFLAFNMSGVAQGVIAYDLTGRNGAVGIVMFWQGVAMLMLNPFGGAIADRFNKRLLIMATQSVIGLTFLAMALLLITDQISIFWLAAGSFVTGTMFAILGPSRTSLLAQVVPKERVGNAMALLQVGGNFGRICAPFLGGALLSISAIGNAGTYFVIFGMFTLVLLTMSQIPIQASPANRASSVLADAKEGFRYVRVRPQLLHSLIGFYAVTALGYSFWVVMPGLVKDDLHSSTATLGAVLGVTAAGGLVGSITVASMADSKLAPLYLKLSSLLAAVSLIAMIFAPGILGALIVMAFAGAGIASFQTLNNSIALRMTNPAYYGRIMGLMQVAWGMISLASLPTGALADEIGERAVLGAAGATMLCILVLLYWWERRIRARGEEPAPAVATP